MWIMLFGLYVDIKIGVLVYIDVELVVKVFINMVFEWMFWGIDWLYLIEKMYKFDDVLLFDMIVVWIGCVDWQQMIFVVNLVKFYGFIQVVFDMVIIVEIMFLVDQVRILLELFCVMVEKLM